MDIADILKQYADRPTDTHTDFDEVARQVPPDVLGSGIAQAFRSEQTPDFGNMGRMRWVEGRKPRIIGGPLY